MHFVFIHHKIKMNKSFFNFLPIFLKKFFFFSVFFFPGNSDSVFDGCFIHLEKSYSITRLAFFPLGKIIFRHPICIFSIRKNHVLSPDWRFPPPVKIINRRSIGIFHSRCCTIASCGNNFKSIHYPISLFLRHNQ